MGSCDCLEHLVVRCLVQRTVHLEDERSELLSIQKVACQLGSERTFHIQCLESLVFVAVYDDGHPRCS